MREIKFRAWWTHPESESRGFDYFKVEEGWKQSDPCQDLLAVEQFTGLRDKNGREIYEGDIVFVDGNLFYVEWRGAGDWFIDPIENDAFMFTPEIYDLEIIGNIHENPELINNEVTHG